MASPAMIALVDTSPADVLIVACAMRHRATVLHRDKHIASLLTLAAGPRAK